MKPTGGAGSPRWAQQDDDLGYQAGGVLALRKAHEDDGVSRDPCLSVGLP